MLEVRIVDAVRETYPETRTALTITRRLLKTLEELGETAEAFLCVTSENNPKGKSWEDVREEAVDTLIMLIDCALTYEGEHVFTQELHEAIRQGINVLSNDVDRHDIEDLLISASQAITEGFELGRYGMNKFLTATKLIAAIAFAPMGDLQDIDARKWVTFGILEKKLDKWKRNVSTAKDSVN